MPLITICVFTYAHALARSRPSPPLFSGGNCELTQPGTSIVHKGVTIIGYTDLPSRLAGQSSALYANNVSRLLLAMTAKDGKTVREGGGRAQIIQ